MFRVCLSFCFGHKMSYICEPMGLSFARLHAKAYALYLCWIKWK